MRVIETSQTLSAYARSLRVSGSVQTAEQLEKLSEFLNTWKSLQISDLCKNIFHVETCTSLEQGHPRVGDIIPVLYELLNLMKITKVHVTRQNDLKAFIEVLSRHESVKLPTLIQQLQSTLKRKGGAKRRRGKTVDSKLIDEFTARLEQALGTDETFYSILDEVEEKLDATTTMALAKKFYGGRSTSKKKAVANIRDRHKALQGQKAKIKSMEGRTAA